MDTLSFKTVSVNAESANKEWVIVDAQDAILGRMVSKVSKILRGKYKPVFTPHADCGDNVIIINAEKVQLTGNKWTGRISHTHSGYPGGQKAHTPKSIFDKSPEKLIRKAVQGMLPKSKLGTALQRNLFIYEGAEHPHDAQTPKVIDLNKIK